ncbi:MAG: hypothetical protein WCB68_12835 [Pyrinomonadaceae bacterium]
MSKFELGVWVSRQFPKTWTHVIKGSFADPQFDTRAATDLFCYDRNAGIGAFFATVKNGKLDDGTLVQDGPHQVGANHTFSRRWTHIVNGPFAPPFPGGVQLLFYDATSGVGEFYATDGLGNLTLKKHHSGWRTSWTLILAGHFGTANLLFYDATDGTGAFYSVDSSGNMHLIRTYHGWLTSWHSIITGNFSSSQNDDLLFYDKSRGIGVFYKIDGDAKTTLFSEHDNWRKTWQHIVSGQFLQNATYDGLLFYEENSGHTEFYSTDGHGSISQIDVNVGSQWSLPWQVILAGEFTPNIGLIGTSRLCSYDSRDGAIRYFYFELVTIKTVIDVNGRWTDGSSQSAVISAAFTSLTVDMSAYHRPAAHGSIIDGSTITVTFPDDATYTGKLQPPNTIRWSNGSAWRKI